MISELLPFVVAGLATGSVYSLAGAGLVLTYKTSGIFNFAHGAQAALGAYVMWDLWRVHGVPWPLAFAGSLGVAGVLAGLLLERLAGLLSDRPASAKIVASVGLLVALQGALAFRYGSVALQMPYFLPTRLVSIAGTNVRYEQIILVLLAAGAATGLGLLFRTARIGLAMQAVVDEPDLLELTGTRPARVRRVAWVIGSCFAAASGAILAPTLGLDAVLLTLLVVQAFGAAAIGRFSSIPMTYVGGLIVGVGQEVLKFLVSKDFVVDHVSDQLLQPLPSNVPFLVLFGTLLFSSAGQFVERGAPVAVGAARSTRRPRPLRIGGAAVGIGLLALVPYVTGTRLVLYLTAMALVTLFASLVFLVRVSGQVSLCQMAFAAIGSATSAHLCVGGVPFPFAVLLGGLVVVPVGALIAIPAIRLSGTYVAIATFGFGILIERLVFPTSLLFGAAQQVEARRPGLASSDTGYYFVLLAVAGAACALVVLIRRGRLGRMLRMLAEAPESLTAHGASPNVVRTAAFGFSAFLAGVSGAMLGPVAGTTSGGLFSFGTSLTIVAVLYVAGAGLWTSPFVAAVLYQAVPGYIDSDRLTGLLPLGFGVAALVAATGMAGAASGWLAARPRIEMRSARRSPSAARLARFRPTVPGGA